MGLFDIINSKGQSTSNKQGGLYVGEKAFQAWAEAIEYKVVPLFIDNDSKGAVAYLTKGFSAHGVLSMSQIYPSTGELSELVPIFAKDFINQLLVAEAPEALSTDVPEVLLGQRMGKAKYAVGHYMTPVKNVVTHGYMVDDIAYVPLYKNTFFASKVPGEKYDLNADCEITELGKILSNFVEESREEGKAELILEAVVDQIFKLSISRVHESKKQEVSLEIAARYSEYASSWDPINAILLAIGDFVKKGHLANIAKSHQNTVFEALL